MNTLIDFNRVQEQIKKHEGLRLRVYRDTVGVNTIGYGHNMNTPYPWNIQAKYEKNVSQITKQDAEEIFQVDFLNALYIARNSIETFDSLPGPKKEAFINMAFNLGNRIKYFRKMINAINRFDYLTAANEMENSIWARQVGKRARELADIIRF